MLLFMRRGNGLGVLCCENEGFLLKESDYDKPKYVDMISKTNNEPGKERQCYERMKKALAISDTKYTPEVLFTNARYEVLELELIEKGLKKLDIIKPKAVDKKPVKKTVEKKAVEKKATAEKPAKTTTKVAEKKTATEKPAKTTAKIAEKKTVAKKPAKAVTNATEKKAAETKSVARRKKIQQSTDTKKVTVKTPKTTA